MNIFDNLDFYPTPNDVIETMFEEASIIPTGKIILEPSDGAYHRIQRLSQELKKQMLHYFN
jgi:hypothetical protein